MLQRHPALVGTQDLGFVVGQLGGHEALGIGHGLFAGVVRGHVGQVGARDLDVVAEDAVVLDLERGDPGALALARLDGHDLVAPARGDGAQLVQLGRYPGPDESAFLGDRRRVVFQSGHDPIGDVLRQVLAQIEQVGSCVALGECRHRIHGLLQGRRQIGHLLQRPAQHHQIARTGHAQARAADQPLDVAQLREDLAAGFAHRLLLHQALDGIVAAPDAGNVEQREEQPATQQPGAHGGGGDVQGVEQRALPLTLQHGLDELQVRARLLVDDQELVAPKQLQAHHWQGC